MKRTAPNNNSLSPERALTVGLIALTLIALPLQRTRAQQTPLYSQYSLSRFVLNPAVAGVDGYTTVGLIAREQWLGFPGTPKTHSITFDSKILPDSYIEREIPIKKKERKSKLGNVGFGGHLFNDHNYLLDRTGFEGSYAYHVPFDRFLLSMGLSVNFYQLRLNSKRLNLSDGEHDPVIDGSRSTLYSPDANLGVYIVAQSYYAGLSVVNVMQSALQFGRNSEGNFTMHRQVNLMAGYSYTLNEMLRAEPSFLLKWPQTMSPQLDVQLKTYIRNDYWAGLTYRTGSAICVFGGARVDRYLFGYAFDYNFSPMMKYSSGSHEIMAAIKFGDTARRYKWLNAY